MTRWRDQRFWRLPGLSGLVAFMAKRYMRCSLWINYKWRLHTVIFVASPAEGKHHRTNDEPQVMNWAQEREKQAKINPSLRKWNQFISIFMPVLLRFNNYIGFFHASLAINRSYYAKQYQRHAVIYAMTERGLPLNGSSQMRDSTGTSLSGKMNRCSTRPCSLSFWLCGSIRSTPIT